MGNAIVVPETGALIPLQVAAAGETAARRFIEFFTANIRNRNTRQAYALAVSNFFRWCERRGLTASSGSSSPCMSPPTSSS